ncbi:MAG: ZIP family metal transporter [Clostridia bacterium]|nr:ZIP family metal transporter [Clostridia bacterium]
MWYSLLFSFIAFALCCLGASLIFFVKNSNAKVEAFLHAFAGGVMVASSVFSLILPASEYCTELALKDYIILPICFLCAFGVVFLLNLKGSSKNGQINVTSFNLGMALHNIPEGMCIGFSVASAVHFGTHSALVSAIIIALGIGIQNIPEGSSVAFPLYSLGYSRKKSFATALLIGLVEVPAGIIAYLLGLNFIFLMPYMLCFAAGIMLVVAVCELMPEALAKNKRVAILSFCIGFLLMMTLDVALG